MIRLFGIKYSEDLKNYTCSMGNIAELAEIYRLSSVDTYENYITKGGKLGNIKGNKREIFFTF